MMLRPIRPRPASFRVRVLDGEIAVSPTAWGRVRLLALRALLHIGARVLDLACRCAPVPMHLTITVDPPEARPR